jgi:hypothetical protein
MASNGLELLFSPASCVTHGQQNPADIACELIDVVNQIDLLQNWSDR